MNSKADKYIDQVHQLLPAPRVIVQLLQLVNAPFSDNREVVNLIGHDPSLTANVLRVSNSSYYGTDHQIDNLDEAVMRLGSREVYRLVVAISCGMVLTHPSKRTGREDNALLDHSIAAATAAQLLARDLGEDDNLAFTATLLHDIGKIVIAAVSDSFYSSAQTIQRTETELLSVEERVLGVTHAEVGGQLLQRWRFPENLIQAIRFHHRPVAAPNHQRLAGLLHLGNAVAYELGRPYGHQQANSDLTVETGNLFGLPANALSDYAAKVTKKLESASCSVAGSQLSTVPA
jgi:putative nucleotidyltransferase with HDIG domain